MRRLVQLAALATILSGCARNAALEIELTVPAQPVGTPQRYTVLLFETGETSFADEWHSGGEFPGTALGADAGLVHYSIVTQQPAPLLIKVQFCLASDCSTEDSADIPAVWYRLERPFYIGQRTRWHPTIAFPGGALPSPPDPDAADSVIDVGICEIEGCIDATSMDVSYCRLTGEHFCE